MIEIKRSIPWCAYSIMWLAHCVARRISQFIATVWDICACERQTPTVRRCSHTSPRMMEQHTLFSSNRTRAIQVWTTYDPSTLGFLVANIGQAHLGILDIHILIIYWWEPGLDRHKWVVSPGSRRSLSSLANIGKGTPCKQPPQPRWKLLPVFMRLNGIGIWNTTTFPSPWT